MKIVATHRTLLSLLIVLLACIGFCAAFVGMAAAAPAGPTDLVSVSAGHISPAITLTKTVSIDGNCGSTQLITATWGTAVTYCYTVTNFGDVTFTTHTLTDTLLSTILLNFPYLLAPGSTTAITATWDPPNLYGLIENCARWQASTPDGVTAEANDCAAVFIHAPTDVAFVGFGAVSTPTDARLFGLYLVLFLLGSAGISYVRRRSA